MIGGQERNKEDSVKLTDKSKTRASLENNLTSSLKNVLKGDEVSKYMETIKESQLALDVLKQLPKVIEGFSRLKSGELSPNTLKKVPLHIGPLTKEEKDELIKVLDPLIKKLKLNLKPQFKEDIGGKKGMLYIEPYHPGEGHIDTHNPTPGEGHVTPIRK